METEDRTEASEEIEARDETPAMVAMEIAEPDTESEFSLLDELFEPV